MLPRFTRSLFAATAAALSLWLATPAASAATPTKAAATGAKDDAKKPGGDKAKKDDAKKDDADKAKKDDAKDAKKGKLAKKDDADKAKKDDAKDAKDAKKAGAKGSKKDDAAAKKDDAKGSKKDDAAAKKDDAKDAKKGKLAKKDDAKDAASVKGTASIGAPNKGRLQGAVKLKSSRSLKVRERAQAWALPALAKLLQRAAGKVAKHHARSVMLVGDLSQKSGGALTGHNSHQSGRDADVGFYISNSKGQPAAVKHFIAFDGAGKSTQVAWAQFDDARNWSLVEALVTDKDTTVRYIFVSNPLRARMIAYAKKEKVAKDLLTRAELVLMSPRDADVHDDHFHVRIACPDTMKGVCIEESGARPGSAPVAVAAAKGADATGDAKAADAKTDAKTDAPKADAPKADDAPKTAAVTVPAPAPVAKAAEPAKAAP